MVKNKSFSLKGVLSLLMGCVAFSACSSSNDDMVVIPENKDLLHIRVMQEDNESGVLWEKGDIGLFVLGDDASLAVTNQLLAVSGGSVANPHTNGSRYIAYAPYQEAWNNALAEQPFFEILPDQSLLENYVASDLIAGASDASNSNVTNEITLAHLLAKVVVSVVDETGNYDFKTGTSLHLLGMKNVVKVDLNALSIATVETSFANIDMYGDEATDRRLTAMAIVAPQQKEEAEYWIKLNLGKLNYLYWQELVLEAGKKTTIKLRFTNEGLMPGGTSVTDWETDENGSELDTEEYQ